MSAAMSAAAAAATGARRHRPRVHIRSAVCVARHRYLAVRGTFMYGCGRAAGALFAAGSGSVTGRAAPTASRFFFEIAR